MGRGRGGNKGKSNKSKNTSVKSKVSKALSGVKSAVSRAVNSVKSKVSKVSKSISKSVKSTVSKVSKSVKSTVSRNVSKLGSIRKSVTSGVKKGISKVSNLGKSVKNTVSRNISKLGKIGDTPASNSVNKVSKMHSIERANRDLHGDNVVNALKQRYSDFKIARAEGSDALAAHRKKDFQSDYLSKLEAPKPQENLLSKIRNMRVTINKDAINEGVSNWAKDTARDTWNAFTDTDRSQQFQLSQSEKDKAWAGMTVGERFKNLDQHPMGDMFTKSYWNRGLADAKGLVSTTANNWFRPQNNEMAIGHQFAAAGSGALRNIAGFASLTPNIGKLPGVRNVPGLNQINQQDWAQSFLGATQADDPRLRKIQQGAQIVQGIKGGIQATQGAIQGIKGGISSIRNAGALNRVKGLRSPALKQIFHGTSTGAAKNIAKTGIKPSTGMLGRGAYGSTNYGISTSYRGGLKGTPFGNKAGTSIRSIVPSGARTLRGATVVSPSTFNKGMRIAQKVQAGAGGAKAQQIRNLMNARTKADTAGRSLRSLAAGRIGDVGLGAAGIGLGAAGLAAGAARVGRPIAGAAFNAAVSDEGKIKSAMEFAGQPFVRNAAEGLMGEGAWNELGRDYVTNLLEGPAEKGTDYLRSLKGIQGWIGGIQANKIDKNIAKENLPGVLDNGLGTYSLAKKKFNPIPGAIQQLSARPAQFLDLIRGKDPRTVGKIISDRNQLQGLNRQPVGTETNRDRARLLRNTRSSGGGGNLTIRDYDPNKVNIQSNPYGQAQAGADESDLAEFWNYQRQVDAAAAARLKDIETDRSTYNQLLSDITRQQDYYTGETARIQPIGKGYSDELARIQPIGKSYSDELARLKPFDKEYTSQLASLKKDRDYLSGFKMNQLSAEDQKYIREALPQYAPAIANLEQQYKDYQASVAEVTGYQKEYQDYLGELQGKQKEYQDYLGQIQTGQKELGEYATGVNQQKKQFEDYATAFGAAKQASDTAARSYTVRAQQSIAGAFRPNVSGIRTAKGYMTIGSRRNKSAKKRFNRDFRIGSFGDTSMSPINV